MENAATSTHTVVSSSSTHTMTDLVNDVNHTNLPNGDTQNLAKADDAAKIHGVTIQKTTPDVDAKPLREEHSQFNKIEGLQSWRRALIWISLFFGILLSLMDTSIMATAIYTIAIEFDSLAKAFWAILSYQLAYLGFAVFFARISDFVGRSTAVLSAYILFVGFSLGCGWAKSIDQLIVFRTFQGVGGSGLYATAIILLVETSSPKLMPLSSSLIGATIAISGVLGPILGGVLTQYASWRWIFWINGPCGAVGIICFVIGWPHTTTVYDASKRRWAEFDYIGSLLILAASVLVVFGLQQGGTGEYAWNASLVLGTLISGCLSWILLFAYEYYIHLYHRDRIASIFPFAFLTNRSLIAGILFTMLVGFTYLLVVISLPLRFQIVDLLSPSSAGVHMLPLLCFCGLGAAIGGVASSKKNRIWQTFLIASCLILLGSGLLSTLDVGTQIQAKCYGFQIILGLGVGLTFSAASVMSAVSADSKSHSVCQGIVSQVRLIGGSIGIAASNAIFNATCDKQLRGILTPAQIRSLQSNTRIVTTLNDSAREAVRLAYADSFNQSLRICVYVAAAGLIASAFTWRKNPPRILKARAGGDVEAGEEKK